MLDEQNSEHGRNRANGRGPGRRLADFRIDGVDTPHGLYDGEEKLLEAAVNGQRCNLSNTRPAFPADDTRVRPAFLRFLMLGGDEEAPVHERGVQLNGAFIEGGVDLDYAENLKPIRLTQCWIDGELSARNAHFITLVLNGSRCAGAVFDDAKFAGSVSLADNFRCDGSIRLMGAEIRGDLDMLGAQLSNPEGDALACRRLKISRNVWLTNGFVANGKVRFTGAEIGGDLATYGARFVQNKMAENPPDWGEPARAEDALNLNNTTIKGLLWLGPWSAPYNEQAQIEGSLNLKGAHVNVLVDNEESWPVKFIETPQGRMPCDILLDGFVYNRFAKRIDVDERRRWLLRQGIARSAGPIPPQPFEQLIKVLREMGHDHEARQIGLFKESLLHPFNIRTTSALSRPFALFTDHLYGLFTGYGYRPHRLGVAILMMWIASAWFFSIAEDQGAFAPRDPEIWINERLMKICDPDHWTACAEVKNLIPFNAASYAADTIIPIIDLQQRSEWAPRLKEIRIKLPLLGEKTLPSGTLHVVTWCVNIFGALAVILLGAIASGLVKKD